MCRDTCGASRPPADSTAVGRSHDGRKDVHRTCLGSYTGDESVFQMRLCRASRYGVFVVVAALLFAGIACSGGSGKQDVTPSGATTTSTATATPDLTPRTAPSISPQRTASPAATVELSADPQSLVCDGKRASTVTARLLDEVGQPVEDGTPVHFSVQALGSADPINTETTRGAAQTGVIALSGQAGVVVNVTSGNLAAAVRIDCQ